MIHDIFWSCVVWLVLHIVRLPMPASWRKALGEWAVEKAILSLGGWEGKCGECQEQSENMRFLADGTTEMGGRFLCERCTGQLQRIAGRGAR